jgi:WD40 repeat protein
MRRRFLLLCLATIICVSAIDAAPPPPPVGALAYTPSGNALYAGRYGDVAIVESATGGVTGTIPQQSGRVTAQAVSRDGKRLAVASGEPGKSGPIRLYSLDGSMPKLVQTLTAHTDVVYTLDFSPDHKLLASAGYDRGIRLWDVASGNIVRELKDHSDTVYGLAFHRDGKLLASCAADRAVKVWDVATGKRLYTLSDSTDWLYALAWHPDGKRLAAGGVDKSLRVWEISADGGKLVASVFAHQQPVTKLAYSADGTALYTASEGTGFKKWDAAKLVESTVFPPMSDTVLSLALRADGKQLAVGRFDGVCQLFDTATGKPTGQPLPEKPKPPTIGKLTPNAGTRGTTVVVAVEPSTGPDTTWSASHSGVTIVAENAGRLKLTIDAAVPPGPVQLTAKNAAGMSAPATFFVDRFPLVSDASNIDSARRGLAVKLPASMAGVVTRFGEADYYRFEATAGQPVGVQVLTAAIGSKLDPVLELTDSTGQVVAEGSATLAYICPASGTYAIGIRDREFRGGADMSYRLHVGNVPVVTAVVPMGLQRGTSGEVRLVGVHLPTQKATVRVPADAAIDGRHPFDLPMPGEKPLGDLSVVAGEFPSQSIDAKPLLPVPGTADGVIAMPGQTGLAKFRATKGERLIVEVRARRSGSPVDPYVEILDAGGQIVPRMTLRCTAKSNLIFRDSDSVQGGIRLEAWNELAMDDYVMVGNEVMRISQLPLNPDADCNFYTVGGQRIAYFGTSTAHHALTEPIYKVERHPPGATFPPNGMPVFRLNYRNDDGGPGYGKDAMLEFDVPADGEYQVRVGDPRNLAGPHFTYRVTVRQPRPDFQVTFSPTAPAVWKGGSVPMSVTAKRLDGYDGPIRIRLDNLPAGFSAPPTVIEAGQETMNFLIQADAMAKNPDANAPPFKLVAGATIHGKEIVREAPGGRPTAVDPGDIVTTTDLGEVAITPGTESRILVKIERRNGFKGRIPIEVRGLPHGVRVLDIGLNGILITERDTQREVVIYAEPWVKPMVHPIIVLAKREGKGTDHGARGVLLKVK